MEDILNIFAGRFANKIVVLAVCFDDSKFLNLNSFGARKCAYLSIFVPRVTINSVIMLVPSLSAINFLEMCQFMPVHQRW